MKSIRTHLSATILLLVSITIGFIGLFSNVFINRAFTQYITEQGKARSESIVYELERHYNFFNRVWNSDYVHIIGMYFMYEGYILTIFDLNGDIVWDAENHDCWHVMDEITSRMISRGTSGEFVTNTYDITVNGLKVGSVSITYYGPYFISEADYLFIRALNTVLMSVGILAGIIAVFIGVILARRISRPVTRTAEIAKQIAEGNYSIGFERNLKTKELDELASAINYLARTLSKQENIRKRLTTDIAHELRTPLTAVDSHLEAMILGIWEITPERLQGCRDEVKRLKSLVNDLGQLAIIEEENLKLNKTTEDLLVIAQTAADNMSTEIYKKNMSISVIGGSSFVELDRDRMNQVVTNLLSNAVKYSMEGGNIQLEVIDSKQNGVIKVRDNGIGIPEHDLPLIFERFYRTENSRNRKSGGAGIGLTIAKSIVMAHGGFVMVESKSGEGSCFIVRIPKECEKIK